MEMPKSECPDCGEEYYGWDESDFKCGVCGITIKTQINKEVIKKSSDDEDIRKLQEFLEK